ncbi:MAG: hypothetical protein IKS17_01695 [Firmicutes bacterium]|nr:hypothetical protein [Bacillota bacterium]
MKHKKAIISAVAALVIGAAAIGAAVMSKNSPQPPAETTPMTSPAETPSETTTIDFSNAEEVIIGLSDTQLTDELKTQLADINAALENYMSSHKKDKDLLTEYGFLYSDTAGTNVTVKDLVKQGVIQADEETAEYTDIIYIRASDLAAYAPNIDKNDDRLQVFTAYNSSEGYFVSNDFYSEGAVLSQKDYEALIMDYKFTHGEITNPKRGSTDYEGIMAATGFTGEYDVKHIACDDKYAVVVVGSLEDTKVIREYVCVLENGTWTLGMEGLEKSESPKYDVNMQYPKMELGLLPKYVIANYESPKNGFTAYEAPLVQLGLIKQQDTPASYDCGADKFAYMEFGDTKLIGCVNEENKLEFYPVNSVEEAIAYMLKFNADPPVFIINFHN